MVPALGSPAPRPRRSRHRLEGDGVMGGALVTRLDSTIFTDALIDARGYSTDALLAMAETFAIDVADPDPDWPGESGRFLASERLRAIQTELERRKRIARRLNAGTAPADDRRRAA